MKTGWIYFTILPIAAFSMHNEDDFFYVADEADQTLVHIAFDAEEDFEENLSDTVGLLEIDDNEASGLSLLEIDERDIQLLPWVEEGLANEDISAYVERKAKEVTEDYDDVFAYELPTRGYGNVYEPTFERVPQERRNLFGKPRVVASKEDEQVPTEEKKRVKRPIAEKNQTSPKKELVITAPEKKRRSR